MKLKEFLEGKNLFTELGSVEPFPFIAGNEALLETMLILNYGERDVFTPLETLDGVITANVLNLEFSRVWASYIQGEGLLDQLHSEKTTTSTTNNTLNRQGVKTDEEKIAAYNSTNLLTNGGSDSTNTEDETNLEEINSKIVDKDLIKAYNVLNEYGRKTVIKQVLQDISNFLTVDIY